MGKRVNTRGMEVVNKDLLKVFYGWVCEGDHRGAVLLGKTVYLYTTDDHKRHWFKEGFCRSGIYFHWNKRIPERWKDLPYYK